MIILGINENHNASAAIIKDGRVAAAASEERFTREKNDIGYPKQAVEFVLKKAGLQGKDCDCVVYATVTFQPEDPVLFETKKLTRSTVADYVREMYEHWKPLLLENKPSRFLQDLRKEERFRDGKGVHYDLHFLDSLPEYQWVEAFQQERKNVVVRHLGVAADKIRLIDHHTAHACYAYFAASLDRAKKTAVVTADSWGDGCNATVSIACGDTIKEIHRTAMCNLARIYRWITLVLALKPNEEEYKVMGLAPYAKEHIARRAYHIFKETLVVDGMDFKWQKKPADMYFYFKERFEHEAVRFDGIAGGLQRWVEEMAAEWVTNILNELKAGQLVFSGGLSMNVKVNKVLSELPGVDDFFVSPGASDESLSIGAAFCAASSVDKIRPLKHAYLGPQPDTQEVCLALEKYRAQEKFKIIQCPADEYIADLLSAGCIIGRCAGAMEFGARALGNRSILCDPSRYENLNRINEKIKFRDFWMPFTPTILDYRAADYLVNPKRLKSPFMTVAFASTPRARKDFPAAIHPADFTVRPQVLTEDVNPEYYALIKAFEAKTGVGGVLNTSLNLHGEPIVCGAFDALHTFVNSGLDGLLLPQVLLLKE